MRRDLRALFSLLAARFSEPNLSLFRARCWRQVVPPPEVKSQEKPFRCRCWTAAGIDVKGNSRHTDEGWPMKFTPRTWEALAAFSSTPPRWWRRTCARQSMFLLRAEDWEIPRRKVNKSPNINWVHWNQPNACFYDMSDLTFTSTTSLRHYIDVALLMKELFAPQIRELNNWRAWPRFCLGFLVKRHEDESISCEWSKRLATAPGCTSRSVNKPRSFRGTSTISPWKHVVPEHSMSSSVLPSCPCQLLK